MNISLNWINDYLDRPASAQEQANLLTAAGFPIEESHEVELPDGSKDVRQIVELTSNRGDCLCHLGLAREIAALSARTLKPPDHAVKATGPAASTIIKVTNRERAMCPLYTARVIRGVKVGPSPKWLANRLLARGDIPRNNIVDASNFVMFELGQPTHVFDLSKLAGPQIIIRKAQAGETFLPIGEGAAEVKLSASDLVIADADRAVALAGVKGGALSAVSPATTDIVLEAATFAASAVRAASRRHSITSDSSYRFERGVHAGQVNAAAGRLAGLILQLCGGTLCEGVVADGPPIAPARQLTMRCQRCRDLLGIAVDDRKMVECLQRLDFAPQLRDGVIACTVPVQRLDIEREIDLIEEVGRMIGLDAIAIKETLQVRIAPPQATELARRAVTDALVGMGYVETVTHSLVSEPAARLFLPPGMEALRVSDERAKAEPVLRPSLLPSLLRVLALNRDNGVEDVKLFEAASTFAQHNDAPIERTNLAFLHPAEAGHEGIERGLRLARGVIDRLAGLILGNEAKAQVEPQSQLKWLSPGAVVRVAGDVLGTFGLIAPEVAAAFGLPESPLIAAEIGLPAYYDRYPPQTESRALPGFPAIERDVSAIVDERLEWVEVKSAIEELKLQHLEQIDFVTTFRGKQIGAGRKSLTLRTRFRASDRTLKHGEVDPQMESLIKALHSKFSAEIRR